MRHRVLCFLTASGKRKMSIRSFLSPSVAEWASDKADNSFLQRLIEESSSEDLGQFDARQIHGAHFVRVQPEKVPKPSLVIASESCASSIGLAPDAIKSQAFVDLFVGNKLPEGLDSPWASVYGCHCYGQWFGQLGDGRAMSVGEVVLPAFVANDDDDKSIESQETRIELQLKGCGRTPFSR